VIYCCHALAGLNYKFKKVDAVIGYCYLNWNIGGSALDNLTLKGGRRGDVFYSERNIINSMGALLRAITHHQWHLIIHAKDHAGLLPGSVLHGYAQYCKMQRASTPVS
jgi:hypothetical protein